MKNKNYLVPLLIVVLLASSLAGWASYAGAQGPRSNTVGTRQTWEYKVVKNATEAQLNQLGAEGWELVTAYSKIDFGENFYFRRPK